jgi:4'-phosphopantetheinyl transferase EntD
MSWRRNHPDLEPPELPGVHFACRLISPGDEHALLPSERVAFQSSVIKVQRASGAARIAARKILSEMRNPADCPLIKSQSGAPVWPPGTVGSLAHDPTIAIAVVASSGAFSSVGVDIEPAEPLSPDLLPYIATPRELSLSWSAHYGGRALFTIKEAIYKTVSPLGHGFLDHQDVEVDLEAGVGWTEGRTVKFRLKISSHIIALAFVSA